MSQSRQLAAIMFTDIVGYSAIMSESESKALILLEKNRAIHKSLIKQYRGEWLKEIGDGVLASFNTISDAVFCAASIQHASENVSHLQLRIGIHQGEVVFDNNDVFGDGVNIASRIEALAPPGGIYTSSSVYRNILNREEIKASFVKEVVLKNISYPVKVYQVDVPDSEYLKNAVLINKTVSVKKKWLVAMVAFITVLTSVWIGWQQKEKSALSDTVNTKSTNIEYTKSEVLALPNGPRIAVLQFINLSNDAEQDYFVSGLTEDIITGLSKTDLFVLASGTSFKINADSMSIDEIAKELDIQYLLKGSVRTQDNEIRVTAQLIDIKTNEQLWGSTYDRDLTTLDIFALQDDITIRVVSTIADSDGVISRVSLEMLSRKHPDELGAYECVLRSIRFGQTHTAEDHLIARSCLEQTVALDSNYVDALASLAYLYREEYQHGFNQQPYPLERAARLARKAVELDPLNQLANHALALAHFGLKNVEEFFTAAERAIELNPNNANIIGGLGVHIALAGEWERGISLLEKTMLLNPYSSLKNWLHIARASDLCIKDNFDAALVEINQVQFGELPLLDISIIAILVQLGQHEKAQEKLSEVLLRNPEFIEQARDELERFYLADYDLIDLFMNNLNRAVVNENS